MRLALLMVIMVAFLPVSGRCETPVSADSVVDTVAVNVHLHNGNTVYGSFPLIQHLLVDLGVRHTRDGLIDTTWQPYYQHHIALAHAGIKCLFITDVKQSDSLLTSYPSRVPGAFEGYEAPNEYDNGHDPNWVATLSAFMKRLYNAVKSNPATASYPIVGPSLIHPSDYAQVAALAPYFDFANMHNYFGGRNPGTPGWGANGYGSFSYHLNIHNAAWPSKPLMTTETGYITDVTIPQSISESVAGKYVPRLIMEQALHGVRRTYFYELIDEGKAIAGNDGAYGLARQDGSPKPAYTALKNLIATLSDRGPSPSLKSLDFSLTGAPGNLHHLLMGKRDGSYYLAFWLEDQDYDVDKQQETPSKTQQFTFISSRSFSTAQLISLGADGSLKTSTVPPKASIALTAADTVTILKLK